MPRTTTVIIGGGQAGLAASHCLGARGIDHVILERGRVAERWRSQRWDSLRLLTPNWQSRLPGFAYDGPDPDGYMTMPEVIAYFERYAAASGAPVETETTVHAVHARGDGYDVRTNRGTWTAPTVVLATGHSDVPRVPGFARALPDGIVQMTPSSYRRPSDLPEGGVLVVGASASGVQLADEIHASGRPVTLAVGRHTRLPRRYRGRDILWWFDRMGLLDQGPDDVRNFDASRKQPSFQLVGRPDHGSIGLLELATRGVRMVGRVRGADARGVVLDDDLMATTAAADAKLALLRPRIDRFIARADAGQIALAPADAAAVREARRVKPEPLALSWPSFRHPTPGRLDFAADRIRAVVWATGFRRDYFWLRVPVLDRDGDLTHTGGLTPSPGLVAVGLAFQRRRKSAFIDGVGDDARAVVAHLAGLLAGRRGSAA
ncbi:MAG: NAD(P)-binding domain-containing protein [Vicinamibacterales bacterium]